LLLDFLFVGYIYPALLTALVPVRSYILDRWFDQEDLKHLDPFGETEEDYHEEQRVIHHQRNDSFSEDEIDFPNRAEFRGQGVENIYHHHEHHHGHETVELAQVDLAEAGQSEAAAPTNSGVQAEHGHNE